MSPVLNLAQRKVCNPISRRDWLQVGGLGMLGMSLPTLLRAEETKGYGDAGGKARWCIVVMGEFGRSPKVNPWAGRDHWPPCYSVLLTGGGVRGGHLYGKSGRLGEDPSEDPVSPHDIVATLYSLMGVPPETEIADREGRPVQVGCRGQVIRGVIA